METLFCVHMILDDAVLHEYAVRNVQAGSDGCLRMRFKIAALLIAILFIGIVSRNLWKTLLTGGVAVAAFAAQERKRRRQKGRQEEIDRQVEWMRAHLAPGELGMETVYQFLEHKMTWENDRERGSLRYTDMRGVQETEQGFFVSVEKNRRFFFWKTSFTDGNPQEFPQFLEQKMRESGSRE